MPEAATSARGRRTTAPLFFMLLLVSGNHMGCLAFTEFEQEQQDGDNAFEPEIVPPTGSAPQRLCEDDAFSCVADELRRCVNGQWVALIQCAAGLICSAELGDCLSCEPDRDVECQQGRLMQCDATGKSYRVLEDCAAQGLLCDTTLSRDSCLECRPADRKCEENLLLRCVGGVFSGGTSCGSLPCRAVDGLDDYCAECSRPGEEACGANQRVTCSEQLVFEPIEDCAQGCVLEGTSTRCL